MLHRFCEEFPALTPTTALAEPWPLLWRVIEARAYARVYDVVKEARAEKRENKLPAKLRMQVINNEVRAIKEAREERDA